MPRGKKVKKVEELSEVKSKVPVRKDILKQAKALGLFKRNKYNATYEIIVSIKEYEEL